MLVHLKDPNFKNFVNILILKTACSLQGNDDNTSVSYLAKLVAAIDNLSSFFYEWKTKSDVYKLTRSLSNPIFVDKN